MADIEILNPAQVEMICSTALATDISKYESEISSLTATLTKIKSNWQSNGMDQQSYIQELDKQIKNVEILKQASEGIFKTVSSYAQNTQQISSKAVDATIGSSYQGYDVKSGYQSAGNAVTSTNPKTLNTSVINGDASIKKFAVMNKDGSLGQIVTGDGVSIADVASQYNIGIDQIAVDIGKNGQSLAWVPATDLLD